MYGKSTLLARVRRRFASFIGSVDRIIGRDGETLGYGFKRPPQAGSKISRKVGRLTCRHPVGTHHHVR
jgi:hypothetical protein